MSSPSSAPSPTSTQAGPSGDKNYPGGTSNNLYLVTFLATLFLLLFVSCAIVLRSYIFRRRYQRRLEEAMAAGMLLAPRSQGSKRKRFGAKPKMFDTWLADGGESWDEMTPLAAQPVFVKRKYKEGTGPKAAGMDGQLAPGFVEILPIAPAPPTTPLCSGVRTLFQRFKRHPGTTTPATELDDVELVATPTIPPAAPGSYKVRVEMLQVSVLVAMPTPTRAQKKNKIVDSEQSFDDIEEDSEETLPEVAFGITRVNYRQPKSSDTALVTPATTPATAAQTPLQTPAEAPSSQANYGSYF